MTARPQATDRLSCEIHVPISPTPSFFTRIRYLTASIREFGGPLSDNPIVVTVGGEQPYDISDRLSWSRVNGVEWRWVDADRFAEHGYYATALERFCYPLRERHVLMLDADVLFVAAPDFANVGVLQDGESQD
jgi:hypothetical protein